MPSESWWVALVTLSVCTALALWRIYAHVRRREFLAGRRWQQEQFSEVEYNERYDALLTEFGLRGAWHPDEQLIAGMRFLRDEGVLSLLERLDADITRDIAELQAKRSVFTKAREYVVALRNPMPTDIPVAS